MLQQWKGFVSGKWTEEVNLRDFIQHNYTPYEGDGSFLASKTEVTHQLWEKVKDLMAVEQEKGILDTDTKVPSSITAMRRVISIATWKKSWVCKPINL